MDTELFQATLWSDVTLARVVLSILILGAAALIQASVGFAAALFGIPFLIWAGNDLMESQVLTVTAMMPQNLLLVWKLRDKIELKETIAPALIRLAAMPIGIMGLAFIVTWKSSQVSQFVGGMILFALALQTLVGIEWKTAGRWYWMLLTFGGSGILQGLSGMSAPPMVLWVHGQRYPADRARAFLFCMYISNFVPQLLLLWWNFGNTVWSAFSIALLSIPVVLITASLGNRLGTWLGDKRLRPVSYIFLAILAVVSLVTPWLRG